MATREVDDSTLTAFYRAFPWPALARDLFNLAESYRIDARIRAAYPGIKRDMDAVYAASGDDRPS